MSENTERVPSVLEPSTIEIETSEEMGVVENPSPSIVVPEFSIVENLGKIVVWANEKKESFLSQWEGVAVTDSDLEFLELERKNFKTIIKTLETMRTEELRGVKEEINRVESQIRVAKDCFEENISFINQFLDKKEADRVEKFRTTMVGEAKELAKEQGLNEKFFDAIVFPDSFLKKKNHTKKALQEAKQILINDLLNIQKTQKERISFAKTACEMESVKLGLINPVTPEELGIVVDETETSEIALKINEIAARKLGEQNKIKTITQNNPVVVQKTDNDNIEPVSAIIGRETVVEESNNFPPPPEPDMDQRMSFAATIEYSSNQRDWLNRVFAEAKIVVRKI